MKAMIFAAGMGSRLKPLTDTLPKALVPVNGKPLLEIVLTQLIKAGFDEIIINVHHFAEKIIDFLASKNDFDVRIEISDERKELLETGGGIKKAAPFFNDSKPFLVHNVDILSNVNLKDFYQASVNLSCSTLLVSERISSRYLLFDERNHLAGWINEKTGEVKSPFTDFNPEKYRKYAFGGVHIIDPSILSHMNTEKWEGSFSIIDFYLSVCNQIPIEAYIPENLELIDVGKPETLQSINKKF